MHDYILKMKAIASILSAAGQIISDKDLSLYILGGLSSEYDFVIVNLTSRYDTLNLQEVQFMLQNQEIRLEQLNSTLSLDIHDPTANLAMKFWKNIRPGHQKDYNQGQISSGSRNTYNPP
ncbi:hypothetical protein PanWU01x14_079610 [Parasponia andersonii]|uniref:Uncharacterized protein n=1 Tax=Parasponia andersonii TaxID=3476 RepID=A0A2P5DBC4_PARAD|nr:hypothetical protein PanWU01x14_079610 [Parasponia andersonii]